jgi:hypothetical protein
MQTRFNSLDILKSTLGEFFKDSFYREGVLKLRKSIKEREYYKTHWKDVVFLILNKGLKEGEPLTLIHKTTNLPLDENTDEEAYKWLTLMLINSLGSDTDMIIEY